MKIFIIDDQDIIVRGIETLVSLNFPHMTWETCRHSELAVELIDSFCPDLIITDIRMPQVDGITLCRHIREKGYEGKIIIISAYDVFEYAKDAISLGVDEYLLKPINKAKLIELIGNTEETLKQNHKIKSLQQNTLKAARKSFLVDFARQKYKLSKGMETHCDELGFSDHSHFRVILMKVVRELDVSGEMKKHDEDSGLLEHCFFSPLFQSSWEDQVLANVNRNLYVLFLMNHQEIESDELIHGLSQVQKKTSLTLISGISLDNGNCCMLSEMFTQAKQALDAAFKDNSNVFFYKSEGHSSFYCAKDETSLGMGKDQLNDMVNNLSNHKIDLCEKSIDEFFDSLLKMNITPELICEMCYKLCLSMIESLKRYGYDTEYMMTQKNINYFTFKECASMSQLKNVFERIFKFVDSLISEYSHDDAHIVSLAKQLVDSHLREASLQYVADRLEINKTYLSTLFKQNTGEKFKDYVKKKKIETAKLILRTTSHPVSEIAGELGYLDSKYFSRIFSMEVGLKPIAYRNG